MPVIWVVFETLKFQKKEREKMLLVFFFYRFLRIKMVIAKPMAIAKIIAATAGSVSIRISMVLLPVVE